MSDSMKEIRVEAKRRRGRPKAVPSLECPYCGEMFHRSPSQRRTHLVFCSHRCSASYYGTFHMNSPKQRKERSKRMRGYKNPNWRGGKIYTPNGEVLIRIPHHPRARKSGYVFEKYLHFEALTNKKVQRSQRVKMKQNYEGVSFTLYTGHLMRGPECSRIIQEFHFPDTELPILYIEDFYPDPDELANDPYFEPHW